MNKSQFLCQLDDLLELEPGTLKGGESLDGLEGWGSLAVLGYMAIVNEKFGEIISPMRISSCVTIDDLVALANCPA